MGGLWNDAKYRDKDSTSCYEEGAEDHPKGKYVTKDKTRKESVP